MLTKYVGNTFLGKTFLQVLGIGGVCPAGVLVVCQLCFGGRWYLVVCV